MSETDISDRISILIEKLKISKNTFAKALNTSSSRISNITTKRNRPDSDLLAKILNVYTNVSGLWLLTGRGPIFLSPDDSSLSHFEGSYLSQIDLEKAADALGRKLKTPADDHDLFQYEGDFDGFIRSFPPERILRYAIENRTLKLERMKIFDIVLENVFDKLSDKKKAGLVERFLKKVKAHELIAKLLVSEVLTDRDVEVMTTRFLKYKGMSG